MIRANPWRKVLKNRCGTGQPPVPHRSWISLVCLPAAMGSRTTVLVRQRSLGVPLLPVLAAQPRFRESLSRSSCGSQQPNPLQEQAVRRPQCPVNQHALARVSDFPLAIHPRESPAATSVTAIIVRQALRVPTFSLNPLWARTLQPATENPCPRVNKLWTMRLPCGSLRKMREKF